MRANQLAVAVEWQRGYFSLRAPRGHNQDLFVLSEACDSISHYTFLPFGKNPSPPKSDKAHAHTQHSTAAPPILYERVRRR